MSCPQYFQTFIEHGPYINSIGENSIPLPAAYAVEQFREWFLENGIYLGPVEALPNEVVDSHYATHASCCYANAQMITLDCSEYSYYEGFMFFPNSRTELHGFNVKNGNTYDFTSKHFYQDILDAPLPYCYFGVPIPAKVIEDALSHKNIDPHSINVELDSTSILVSYFSHCMGGPYLK